MKAKQDLGVGQFARIPRLYTASEVQDMVRGQEKPAKKYEVKVQYVEWSGKKKRQTFASRSLLVVLMCAFKLVREGDRVTIVKSETLTTNKPKGK